MSAKILQFEIPDSISKYEESIDVYDVIEQEGFLSLSLQETLGLAGRLIQEHKYLVLNCINAGDFYKPHSEWSELTKYAVNQQMFSFNQKLLEIKDKSAVLLGGENVLVKRARFSVRDIEHERQELARILGIVTEVLFLEFVVYEPEGGRWFSVEDYQIKKIEK